MSLTSLVDLSCAKAKSVRPVVRELNLIRPSAFSCVSALLSFAVSPCHSSWQNPLYELCQSRRNSLFSFHNLKASFGLPESCSDQISTKVNRYGKFRVRLHDLERKVSHELAQQFVVIYRFWLQFSHWEKGETPLSIQDITAKRVSFEPLRTKQRWYSTFTCAAHRPLTYRDLVSL